MIYVGRDGEIIGRFDGATFREKLMPDEILWTDYFLPEGSDTWRRVHEYRFGDLPKKPPSPANQHCARPRREVNVRKVTRAILLGILAQIIVAGIIGAITGGGNGSRPPIPAVSEQNGDVWNRRLVAY